MKRQINEVKMIEETADHVILGGYLVVFGGRDLEGEGFTKNVDYMLDYYGAGQPVYVDHSLPVLVKVKNVTYKLTGIEDPVGRIVSITPDDTGLYTKLMIDRSNQYWAIVDGMRQTGRLGLSSGAVDHLVKMTSSGIPRKWPIGEGTLTLYPSEPRTITLGVDQVKIVDNDGSILEGFSVEDNKENPKMDEDILNEEDQEDFIDLEDKGAIVDEDGNLIEEDDEETVDVNLDETSVKMQARIDKLEALVNKLSTPVNRIKTVAVHTNPVPSRGSKVQKANKDFANFVKRGGRGRMTIKATQGEPDWIGKRYIWQPNESGHFVKTVNITTPTEGQETVPIGHYNQIISRIEEIGPLDARLGALPIPGRGTTVNVPTDDAASGVMTPTTESAQAPDGDPTFGQVAMALVSYRTKVRVTYETLRDEDSNLLAFLSNHAARKMVNTRNDLLITEAETNGTQYKIFATNSGFAAGEMEDVAGADTLAPYVDDMGGAWIMRNSTRMKVLSVDGNRFYADDSGGGVAGVRNNMLLDFPVARSNFVDAVATTAKSVLLGNWAYMGYRLGDGFQVLRDPYSRAENAEVVFHYFMSAVYAVTQSDAIGYGEHPV